VKKKEKEKEKERKVSKRKSSVFRKFDKDDKENQGTTTTSTTNLASTNSTLTPIPRKHSLSRKELRKSVENGTLSAILF